MPICYGQVQGIRFDNEQREHDPDNPKRSIYQPKEIKRRRATPTVKSKPKSKAALKREKLRNTVKKRCYICGRFFVEDEMLVHKSGNKVCGNCFAAGGPL